MRAAIVLLPLLGITNSLQMVASPIGNGVAAFATWSIVTTFLTSFQGFFVSLIYCFLNQEVSIYCFLNQEVSIYCFLNQEVSTYVRNEYRGSYIAIGVCRDVAFLWYIEKGGQVHKHA